MERGVPSGEFLIAGGDERGAVFCKFGIASYVESEELFDGCGIGELDRVFSAADEFSEAAEEEDFDASGLGNGGHRGIVTRAQEWGQ